MPDLKIGKTNVTKLIGKHVARQKDKWIFMLEVPEDKYFDVNIESIKVLVKKGFSGVYVSLHRPYENIVSLFKKNKININKLHIIDAASSQAEIKGKETEKCTYISKQLNIDELTRAIYKMLPRIKGKNKFLFLDSITTLTLYQPLSEVLRFAEFLSRSLTKKDVDGVIVNVAKDLSQKKFIKDIVLHIDEVIKIGEK